MEPLLGWRSVGSQSPRLQSIGLSVVHPGPAWASCLLARAARRAAHLPQGCFIGQFNSPLQLQAGFLRPFRGGSAGGRVGSGEP